MAKDPGQGGARDESLQYVFLNRAPSQDWGQGRPATVVPRLFTDVTDALAVAPDGGTPRRRLGASFIISYHDGPGRDRLTEIVRRLLALSVETDVPVLLTLDGQNWWDGRPDLWNWWDENAPGYDPANVHNVEWTGPGPEHAVKVCWRNWGRQLRVRPMPNLHSPRFRESSRAELTHFAGVVLEFMRKLPPEKRHLVPGVKVGWEASIGIHSFHFPNGNALYEAHPRDESHDPQQNHNMAKDFAAGFVPLGYAALASERDPRRPPGPVTLADHERLVGDYIRFLAATTRAVGFEPHEIFLHAGGQYAPWPLHYTHRTAITPDGVPGYSLYDTLPDDAGDLRATLAEARRDDWCAAEWLTKAKTADGWAHDLERTLSFGHCRSVTIYNWEGVRGLPHAVAGIRRALAGPA